MGALVVLLGSSAFMAYSVGYAPDESNHWLVVKHYADDLTPTTWQDFEYGAARGHPYHLYSPLPYVPYLPTEKLGDALGPVASATRPAQFIPRLGGLFVVVAQFALTIALVRRMTRSRRLKVSIAVAFVVNLLPSLRFLHSYMNADALTIAVGTACALVALRVLQRARVTLGDAALVGLIVGIAGLSRYHALPMAVLPLGALVWRVARDHGAAIRPRLRLIGLAAAISLALALPVQLAVMSELANGHISASADHEALRVDTFNGKPAPDLTVHQLFDLRKRVMGVVWGDAWANVTNVARLSDTRFVWFTAIALVGLAGLLIRPRRVLTPTGRAVALASAAAGLVTLLLMSAQWPFDLAGRFLLPAGVPLLCGAVLGTAELLSRWRRVHHPTRVAVGA